MKNVFLKLTILAILILSFNTAQAATFTVTKTADMNDGACDADCPLKGTLNAVNDQTKSYPIKVVGDSHTLVLLSDGSVAGWGTCNRGELGPMPGKPRNQVFATALVSIKLPGKAIDIAAGESSSFALLDDGTVVSWGSNLRKMLGNTGSAYQLSNGQNGSETPVKISKLNDIVQIAAAATRAVALKRDGTVYAWGQSENADSPVPIAGLRNISQISVGSTHAMALDASGNVWTWGDNMYGVLGRKTESGTPAQVPGLSDVISISAGSGVSTVVKKDGTVWVWGSNWNGQFGNGSRTAAPVYGGLSNQIETVPQRVPGVQNAVLATSGLRGRHTLVLLKDGSLKGWGNTDWGQLGAGVLGTFQESAIIPKITGVKAVFAVGNNSYAVKNDNTLWIWGADTTGGFPLKVKSAIPKLLGLGTL
ncbi:MAG: hypothetical protein R2747_18910 [Pyrinomonadaceae bacterium]